MTGRVDDQRDARGARARAVFIRIIVIVLPDRMVITPVVPDNAQVGFGNRPVLLEIVMGLLAETGRKRVPEKKADAQQQNRENYRINSGEREPKATGNVLAFGQKALRKLLYTCVSSWGSLPGLVGTDFSGASII
jgi:hypothetical protein